MQQTSVDHKVRSHRQNKIRVGIINNTSTPTKIALAQPSSASNGAPWIRNQLQRDGCVQSRRIATVRGDACELIEVRLLYCRIVPSMQRGQRREQQGMWEELRAA
jgi:hypothetical protein